MGFRFFKPIKLGKGLKLNVGRKSVSMSVGSRGSWFNFGTRGIRTTLGIPGSGFSFSSFFGFGRQSKTVSSEETPALDEAPSETRKRRGKAARRSREQGVSTPETASSSGDSNWWTTPVQSTEDLGKVLGGIAVMALVGPLCFMLFVGWLASLFSSGATSRSESRAAARMPPQEPSSAAPSSVTREVSGHFTVVNIRNNVLYTKEGPRLCIARTLPPLTDQAEKARAALWNIVGGKIVTAVYNPEGAEPHDAEIRLPDGRNLTLAAVAVGAVTAAGRTP